MTHLLRTAVPAMVRLIITIRFVRNAKVQNTRWVREPNLALITCTEEFIFHKQQAFKIRMTWTEKETTDLEECLGPWGSHLKHDGQDGEDDDLDSGAPRVPVGPADTVLRNIRMIVKLKYKSQSTQPNQLPRPIKWDLNFLRNVKLLVLELSQVPNKYTTKKDHCRTNQGRELTTYNLWK